VPGRKSDVLDCQWIQRLHSFGLLRASFRPADAIVVLRVYQQKIADVDQCIESYLATLTDQSAGEPLPTARRPKRQKGRQDPLFDVRASLFRVTGLDLTSIDGIGPYAALQIVSEIGTDMSCWETEKHFCSWLALCPGVNKTGGRQKSKSGKTRPSANRVARVLRLSAQSLLRADCALGAFARRMRAKLGGPQAITAVAHKLAKIVYGMLKYGKTYVDLGVEYYDQQFRQRQVEQLRRRAERLGLQVTEAEIPYASQA
jgi:hypothetical protein